jgi:peptidoglycan hydrolase CwlO-like protein
MVMDWVFIAFAVVTVIYAIVIFKDFVTDSRIQKSLLDILGVEQIELEGQVEMHNQECVEVVEQIKKGKETVKELQDIINNQKIEIHKFEEGMAKRGKYRVE